MPPDEDEYVPADVVSHRNAMRQNAEAIKAIDDRWRARQQRIADQRKAAAQQALINTQPIPVTSASAALIQAETERGANSIAAEVKRDRELREEQRQAAIDAANDLPVKDPRTTAEKLAGEISHQPT